MPNVVRLIPAIVGKVEESGNIPLTGILRCELSNVSFAEGARFTSVSSGKSGFDSSFTRASAKLQLITVPGSSRLGSMPPSPWLTSPSAMGSSPLAGFVGSGKTLALLCGIMLVLSVYELELNVLAICEKVVSNKSTSASCPTLMSTLQCHARLCAKKQSSSINISEHAVHL